LPQTDQIATIRPPFPSLGIDSTNAPAAMPVARRCTILTAVAAILFLQAKIPLVCHAAEPAGRPASIRIRWGGGTPQAWSGRIEVVDGHADAARQQPISWKTLSTEPDAAALAHDEAGGIAVHQHRPIASDGVEITVDDWQRARLRIRFGAASAGETTATLDLAVADILAEAVQQPLDGDGNRLTVEPAPGDTLRVTLLPNGQQAAVGAVCQPGDVLRFRVDPLLAIKPGEGQFELRLRLGRPRQEKIIDSQAAVIMPQQVGEPRDTLSTGRLPTPFGSVEFEVSLPVEEGVYEVTLDAVERGGLRWTRPLATRTIQVVALSEEPLGHPPATAWGVIYELDPGSPKLHERLRRLPARGLPAVPVPNLSLPAMPLPSLSRPRMPFARLPDVPRLPEVPLPNVSSMVPRFGGLLAAGHSLVVPHPLGPMLQLPPAPETNKPSWEGIVVAGAPPGMPHIVEIDYPLAQQATIAACVLEPDATATTVELRHAGGFEVLPPATSQDDRLGTHRFVFWPTTRNPVVVIANPARNGSAFVGPVRVLAGPQRLPAAPRVASQLSGAIPAGRSTLALFDTPDLYRLHGGASQVATTGGKPFADWSTHLAGIQHSADALAARGLAGAVLTVYAEGGAAWPSMLTRQAARWDPAAADDSSLDPLPKDVLGAIATVYGREGLSLVPAFTFNAAIPELEAALTGDAAVGIACVGGDGRPRRSGDSIHYNILDPRVQEAVQRIVLEGAARIAHAPAAAGVAVIFPHDGWLHLPGIDWGLDDATFGRFLSAIGHSQEATGPPRDGTGPADAADPARFAERARLVSGPLRKDWLAWRTGILTDFHARLAAVVAEVDSRWPLYIVPTTLFAEGELAKRFHPSLNEPPRADDLLAEIGLIASLPEGMAGTGRMVFMTPYVHSTGGNLRDRSTVAQANAVMPLATATAGRRGGVLVLQPQSIDLSAVAAHGPFGTATPPGLRRLAIVPAASEGDCGLAEALVGADAEVIFDMRATVTLPNLPPAARRAYESLPSGAMRLAAGLPAPLVVRSAAVDGVTRIEVVNAGPAAAQAVFTLGGQPSAVIDAADGTPLPLAAGGTATVPLSAWGVRSLVIDGGVGVERIAIAYDEAVRDDAARKIERLRQRLAVLEMPAPLDVLDNPNFELGIAEQTSTRSEASVTGWELVEPRRGLLQLVDGLPTADTPSARRGLEFSSRNGLSTLRSNPFPPPATGRISVAAWLRIKPGDPQPPLRIAVEGVEQGREYYQFAAVGGLTGGRPLSAEWSLFVLQVDDLPADRIESMRVRFDLLGPGGVQIDNVRVFDLAFDAEQRGRLAQQIARISHRFNQGDLGAAVVGLEGHWPAFLEAFIDDAAVAAMAREAPPPAEVRQTAPAEERQGMLDRLRGWWQ
jgi:hypothetical protein